MLTGSKDWLLVLVGAVLATLLGASAAWGGVGADVRRARAEPPVKVFLLLGQSNMEGHGRIKADMKRNDGKGSLESAAKNPASAEKFKRLLGTDGTWIVRDDVWVHYLERKGRFTPGFGVNEECVGPEIGFGQVVGDRYNEPVLLVKLAWGGKSLAVDFRPPSSGGQVGPFYTEVITRTKTLLSNLKREFPEFGDRGYELAGIGWHQGWNDRVNAEFVAEYRDNMVNFIRDIRQDLGVKDVPFVIAETGQGGPGEKDRQALALMEAQAQAAELEEFRGNVAFVGTRGFWRDERESPSDQGYHWNSNAETYYLIGEAMGEAMVRMCDHPVPAGERAQAEKRERAPEKPRPGEMSGYLLVPHSNVGKEYNAGFSMYVAAWPLLRHYPGNEFQSGLPGTWMFAQQDTPLKGEHYSDIEGGLGWWRDTRFATTTPKFIMGGVALNFCEWANGPGAGKGRDWDNPAGHYAIAQISPWMLWPPDGLNLKQGTSGELVGYGYLPLPLVAPKATTNGKDIPTGDQSWTLFLNTGNFKGPVAFFVPNFWSRPTLQHPEFAGKFLDARPSEPNKALQMETQYIPASFAKDRQGREYARIAPVSFPRDAKGDSVLVHRMTAYKREALWTSVQKWFEGGAPASGALDTNHAAVHTFSNQGGSTWQLHAPGAADDNKVPINWESFATPVAIDEFTYGYRWDETAVSPKGKLTTLPEFYTLGIGADNKPRWRAIRGVDAPAETGLHKVSFRRPREAPAPEAYVTPEGATSVWKAPGPVAGPFTRTLGDGSVVTYSWYRFADQPAMLNADLTPAEREDLQKKVEMIHRHWTKDREYLPPNTVGVLADVDPALLVTPPKGMEAGYVPIVTRQGIKQKGG